MYFFIRDPTKAAKLQNGISSERGWILTFRKKPVPPHGDLSNKLNMIFWPWPPCRLKTKSLGYHLIKLSSRAKSAPKELCYTLLNIKRTNLVIYHLHWRSKFSFDLWKLKCKFKVVCFKHLQNFKINFTFLKNNTNKMQPTII